MNTIKPNGLHRRTGLFGGTFNPIHNGHLKVAMDVLKYHRLDSIYFIPSARPPHKTGDFLASARDRLQMVRLALKGNKSLCASAVEIERGGPSYSRDTVLDFKARLTEGGSLFFMVGADAFLEIHTWRKFGELFELTAFIVMSRPPDAMMTAAFLEKMKAYVQHNISDGYTWALDGRTLTHPGKQPVHLTPVTPVEISATTLRNMMRSRQPIDHWVAPAVAEFIQQKGLYR
jgi:nicotinate-nucleotide adenylyltransferase